ncbi:MAG: sigma-70 family RNA polymerase sigma factor [Emticicia sp.]|nr:sigma-70 family RNA polymerase sigma factor [Emticicia sp.]
MFEYDHISHLKKRHPNAQKLFFEQYGSTFYRTAYRYVHERADAEDLTSDSFIKIFEVVSNQKDFNDLNHFLAWCKRIVINESLGFLRKKVNFSMLKVDEIDEFVSVDASFVNELEAQDINKMIAKLPIGCRTVFSLFALEGFSHEEIANQLQITIGTSKSQASRARLLLQKTLTSNKYEY